MILEHDDDRDKGDTGRLMNLMDPMKMIMKQEEEGVDWLRIQVDERQGRDA
jgi:hypothetical protein